MKLKQFLLSSITCALVTTLAACNSDDGKDGQNGQDSFFGINATLMARATLNAESPEGAAEIVQYQKSTGYIYAINSSGDNATVEILDLNTATDALVPDSEGVVNTNNMNILATINLNDNTPGDANSIAISDELEILAVAMASSTTGTNGNIAFYDISGSSPVFIKNVTVGALPDMVTFTHDSAKVVVANEGEPAGDYSVDPEGTISIIDITAGVIANTATSVGFTAYNTEKAALEEQGVVFANPTGRTINGNLINTTVAMDLEPEYVTISRDNKTAYVSLQENNAIAVVDLTTKTLTDVKGLGFKDWSQYYMDASDKDGGINFRQYQNLYGMYQPDTIATLTWNNADFIVTANEGDGREYFFDTVDEAACLAAGGLAFDDGDGCLSYIDESRAKDLDLDPTAFADVLNNNDDIGRLKVTTVIGNTDNADDDYEELYTYGARSFSIFDKNGNLVFDSGDDMERITAAVFGDAFNNDEDVNEGDTRSDAKGPEPEALAIGEVNGHTLAFIGLERMAGVMVYDVTNPFDVKFVDYFYNRGTVEGAAPTGDLAPEGMKFVPATSSKPAMLIIGNEISGSVAVWKIEAKQY